MGVDFGPYLTRIVAIVKQNWYNLMPPSVYPPILKQGKLAIEFVILKDGKVSNMAIRASSGDVPLDRPGAVPRRAPVPAQVDREPAALGERLLGEAAIALAVRRHAVDRERRRAVRRAVVMEIENCHGRERRCPPRQAQPP